MGGRHRINHKKVEESSVKNMRQVGLLFLGVVFASGVATEAQARYPFGPYYGPYQVAAPRCYPGYAQEYYGGAVPAPRAWGEGYYGDGAPGSYHSATGYHPAKDYYPYPVREVYGPAVPSCDYPVTQYAEPERFVPISEQGYNRQLGEVTVKGAVYKYGRYEGERTIKKGYDNQQNFERHY